MLRTFLFLYRISMCIVRVLLYLTQVAESKVNQDAAIDAPLAPSDPAPEVESPPVRIPQVSPQTSPTPQPKPNAVKIEAKAPPSKTEEAPTFQADEATVKDIPAAALPPVEEVPVIAENRSNETLSQAVEDRRNATKTPVIKPGGPKKKRKWRKLTSRWLQESPKLTAFLNHLQEVEAEQASLQSTLTTAQAQMAHWIEVLEEDKRKGAAWDDAANEVCRT